VIERPDGQRLTDLAYANPVHDEAGSLLGAVNVLVDISERKRAENALKEADRSKNEFIAMLAHELRNPLAPIRNAVQILHLKGQPSPELQWALEVIERQMRQMTRLIDDLLDLARITGNKLELCRDRVNLEAILRVALETSQPLVEAGGQQLDVAFPPQPMFLNADLTRLSQVISNLLNNAVKYTARGGQIWLRAEQQGSDAVITVGDTGMGIRADVLPRVFEMFAQGDRSSGRSPGGLGIGLTLARRLVEMHGGTITARSDGPGKGSEFIVRLPAGAPPPPAQRPPAETSEVALSFSFRILVVDDNQDAAASLSLLLQIMGNDVRVAHDGLEAVAMAEEFHPDLILLDIGLPGIDGYEAAQRIRRQDRGRDVVLVAVTGWGQQADRHRSRAAGFDHHLVKPVEPDSLTQLLEQAAAVAPRLDS
nr:ATP-binding protein [Pseudomonadota bacterium]